ncbi:C40 family peptidase [Tropicibacter sp. R16_0]|uniref:C40 family peptidase n=1 Tax=Tropicibacter sp. R16_0 TaxID=2821102 RepID=UPI001ADCBD60|nr:NlpC/P60 family protein [Tropicibacter sp. R16_0]MBO9451440.1 C40 family peptidase [Tropicibacter sp. R16_0]
MSWSNRYVGIPQADHGRSEMGCDCWGLACLVYAQELSIELPGYDGEYVSPDERAEIAGLIDAQEAVGPWSQVETPQAFDLLLFRRGRWRSHVGIFVARDLMLHIDGSDQARVASLSAPRWAVRLCGIYRHAQAGDLS